MKTILVLTAFAGLALVGCSTDNTYRGGTEYYGTGSGATWRDADRNTSSDASSGTTSGSMPSRAESMSPGVTADSSVRANTNSGSDLDNEKDLHSTNSVSRASTPGASETTRDASSGNFNNNSNTNNVDPWSAEPQPQLR